MTANKIIAIMGPTASGKTAAALEIAQHQPSEIISVDSALIYRGMDIGSAKPSAAERAAVPHHLIDIIEPTDSYSVAQFLADTRRLIDDIQARGKQPILVGGTMMYYKAMLDGLGDLPQADAALRAELDAEAATYGVPHLHARLAQLDPVTAARLKPNDSQRIQRALEVIALSGQTMSSLFAQQSKTAPVANLLCISLEPSERAALHQRIAQRFDQMLAHGFMEEMHSLRARGDLHRNLPSMRCVGYRQAWEYLDGDYDYATMREHGIIATRQLAKRQLTWLRAMPERIVIDCLAENPNQQVMTAIAQHRG